MVVSKRREIAGLPMLQDRLGFQTGRQGSRDRVSRRAGRPGPVRCYPEGGTMSYDFALSALIPATPKAIYDAWLDSRGHSQMTGGEAEMSTTIGDSFSAWDGYISGKNLELVPHASIVQSWRTTRFTEQDADSKITVTLAPATGGTILTIAHSNVPDGHTGYEQGGWQTHYFVPMQKYFGLT
jgi:activator of HSP90 ATPase